MYCTRCLRFEKPDEITELPARHVVGRQDAERRIDHVDAELGRVIRGGDLTAHGAHLQRVVVPAYPLGGGREAHAEVAAGRFDVDLLAIENEAFFRQLDVALFARAIRRGDDAFDDEPVPLDDGPRRIDVVQNHVAQRRAAPHGDHVNGNVRQRLGDRPGDPEPPDRYAGRR